MKRMLSAGVGDIYQISRVFRGEESGRYHQPEFNLLEWYRVGWDHHRLIQEVDQLLQHLWSLSEVHSTSLAATDKISYVTAMAQLCECDFDQIDGLTLKRALCDAGLSIPESMRLEDASLDEWLDLALSLLIVPQFKEDRFTCLIDYPATQAAYAKIGKNRSAALRSLNDLNFSLAPWNWQTDTTSYSRWMSIGNG